MISLNGTLVNEVVIWSTPTLKSSNVFSRIPVIFVTSRLPSKISVKLPPSSDTNLLISVCACLWFPNEDVTPACIPSIPPRKTSRTSVNIFEAAVGPAKEIINCSCVFRNNFISSN